MLDLTFGEQVKIILSRKGMTIKELAETIEERTGKKMSRQNLTQRLGRDNFQEQDMRMIAEILGCPFHLSILEDGEPVSQVASTDTNEPTEKEKKKIARAKERKDRKAKEAAKLHAAMEQIPSEVAEPTPAAEKEMTLGDYIDIHEELVRRETGKIPPAEAVAAAAEVYEETALEAASSVEELPTEEIPAEPEFAEEMYQEPVYEEPVYEEPVYLEEEPAEEPFEELTEEPEPEPVVIRKAEPRREEHQEKKLTGWRAMFQRRNKKEHVEEPEPVRQEVSVSKVEEETFSLDDVDDVNDFIEYNEPEQETYTEVPVQESVYEEPAAVAEPEEADAEDEDAEDLERGERNPYTGHEYETNSVRMHPKRIGYVQVYDRRDHAWTDMTEWAFLGYQERKKALLGKDYEEPIYLD